MHTENTKKVREIIVIDNLGPEVIAMVQALYSRKPKNVKKHLFEMDEEGAEGMKEKMGKYYVGYNHKSIGDCGSTAIFIEYVSMLAAKAIQDWPLYNGQEASTRYLDMSAQPVLNPIGDEEGQEIQNKWMQFYSHALAALIPTLKIRFPIKEGENEGDYGKAIHARAFDIARGFLPAGATTFVAWHTNLRQAYDHIKELRHHPLHEVRVVASEILAALKAKYPASFGHKEYPSEQEYIAKSMAEFAYSFDQAAPADFTYESRLDLKGLAKHARLLGERPAKAELHQRFRQYGDIVFQFPLDFASYRDLQRHRSAVQEMPMLTTLHGFYPWYLEQLPDELRIEAEQLLADQEDKIDELEGSDAVKQYYVAMGYTVPVKITCPFPSVPYIVELRSDQSVHPTLRVRAQQMGDAIQKCVPGIAMHHDTSPGAWNIKRGLHDIVRKE